MRAAARGPRRREPGLSCARVGVSKEIGDPMSVRLFVGNLSFSLADDALREAFAEVGGVARAEVVRDRFDGRSRGFGFVEMATEDAASIAIKVLTGKEVGGRPLRIELATSVRPQNLRAETRRQY